MLQLAARLVCSNLADVELFGVSSSAICLTIPGVSEEPMCGWQLLQVCYDATSMGVVEMVLGAMMLLWAHIIWLVVLLVSLWRFKHLTVARAAEGAACDGSDSEPSHAAVAVKDGPGAACEDA